MQLSRPPRSLLLGSREPLALALGRDRLSRRDCGRHARSERFQEALVLCGEPRAAGETIDSDEHPQGLSAEHQRHDQTVLGVESKPAETVVVESSSGELVREVLRDAGTQRGLRD